MVPRHTSRVSPRASSLLLLLGLLVLPGGCKKGADRAGAIASASADLAPRGPRASCNLLDQQGTCAEYANDQPVERTLCEGLRGRWSATPCPDEGRVGGCAKEGGETKHYYRTFVELRSFTPEEARADCESELIKGRFTPSGAGAPSSRAPVAPRPSTAASAGAR